MKMLVEKVVDRSAIETRSFYPRSEQRLTTSLAAIFLLLLIHRAPADDVVIYASGANKRETRTVGTISEYTGKSLSILLISGREIDIPTSRVLEIQSQWTAAQKEADGLFASRKFAPAFSKYQAAMGQEKRAWVQRRILAQQVRCLTALGQIQQATDAFSALYEAESSTQDFDCIPLAWTTERSGAVADQRISASTPAILVLIQGSWLLTTGNRGEALAALSRLEGHSDPRIVHLADAQRWRTEIVTAKPVDIDRWGKQIGRMPKSIRGGPLFVYGQALARQKRYQDAALAFMQVRILYPNDYRLSAHALHHSAGALEKLGRTKEALGLYREVVADYAEVPVAAESKIRIAAISKGADSP